MIGVEDLKKAFGMPVQAKFTVEVPSGGDYSGETLVIGKDIPRIDVVWEDTK